MTKDKQIEEMAKILCGMEKGCDGCMWDKAYCHERNYAEEIYNAGYRKSSEVAREIFEEIEGIMAYFPIYGHSNTVILNENDFAELKKKYESEKD